MKKIFIKFYLICLFILSPFFSFTALCLTVDEIYEEIRSFPLERIIVEKPKRQEKTEKLKAVQIFVLPEKDKWDSLFNSFKRGGVNTLIIRVFHNKGDRYHCGLKTEITEGVYFRSKYLPVLEDLLNEFSHRAKGYGFKVFAWMTTRYANYGRNDLKRVSAYSFDKGEFVVGKGIDFFDKYNQEFIKLVFKEIAGYPVDGILLQDDLFYRHNEGFNNLVDEEFYAVSGVKPIPQRLYIKKGEKIVYTDLFYKWREFKSEKIAYFVRELRDAIKTVNPDIKIAVNLTYEAISNPKGALSWLAHNINELKDVSDYFSLMAYHRQIMEELNISFSEVKSYLMDMIKKCSEIFSNDKERVIFKIQIKDWKTNEPISEEEMLDLVNYTKGIKDLSIAIVPYPPEVPEKIMNTLFR
ncbi:MAG: family 10 glycosylhydrolase [Proteobacteria bacterium]|nr:family 10 glycosylhydrolase [Pseudomonadota bacterium]